MLVPALMTLLLASASAPQSDAVSPAVIEPRKAGALSDREIELQLNDLLTKQPERVICISKAPTGTRLAKPQCASLRHWYDFEATRNGSNGAPRYFGEPRPPHELVELIKERMAKKS